MWVGPPPEALEAAGRQARLEAESRGRRACRSSSRVTGDARLPADPQGRGRAAAGAGCASSAPRTSSTSARGGEPRGGGGVRGRHVFAERYVERPRHVEIQLLADAHGTSSRSASASARCSAATRRCSRSPLPALDPALRVQMSDAAVAFARAIGYRSAGTAEFMLVGRDFWFLELNGRIQVEHPVTELVTGVDLVEEQLRIAQGEPLAGKQLLRPRGRGAALRRGSTHVPPPGGQARAPAPSGRDPRRRGRRGGRRGRARLRPDDREAHRARRDARRGARQARRALAETEVEGV